MLTVDVDTGGTMTDALVSDGSRRVFVKVDTTPHDYTVSFVDCLAEAARSLGHEDVEAFLGQVALIRWSSTITTNVLAERRGSKVGLLVSKGHEENLYGSARSPVIDELVATENVVGLAPGFSAHDVLSAVKGLLESGVRRICVSLKGSYPDNSEEYRAKELIEDQYPDHIIGAVPVLLGSEMAQTEHDQTRAHYSLMNAYTHTHLATSLFKAEDMLRDQYRWHGTLLIGHTNGGVARIGKTKAVDTIESGPVFGTFGGAYIAKTYGLANAACFDVGGTTTKASVVRGGAPVFQRGGELMEVPVRTSFAMLRSAAIGGGSVARVRDGRIALGPDSMGAAPGPACYGLGGEEATLTDALLVLGYLDPTRFLGGRRTLDRALSGKVIGERIARPLGFDQEQAALMIRDEAVAVMADLVGAALAEAGLDAATTALLAYGGNGPMFGTLVAERLGMNSVLAFDFGPVLGAFGSSVSDVVHVYERGVGLRLGAGNGAAFIVAAAALHQQATRDLAGEGFDSDAAVYAYEIELGHGDGGTADARFEWRGVPDQAWVRAAGEAVKQAKSVRSDHVVLVRLLTRFGVGAHQLAKRSGRVAAESPVLRSMRLNGRATELPCYRWESLNVGDRVAGPAIVNGATLTCPVPAGWSLVVDDYGNARLARR